MHADGKSTLVSVSKWNSGKVNLILLSVIFSHSDTWKMIVAAKVYTKLFNLWPSRYFFGFISYVIFLLS